VYATHNELRRGQQPGHFGKEPATLNERNRGQILSQNRDLLIFSFTTHHTRHAFDLFCACFIGQQAE
jgi:hypothetical protein